MPKNLARAALVAFAEKQRAAFGPEADAYYKWTCRGCGKRNTYGLPNVLPERGLCENCGASTTIQEGGVCIDAFGTLRHDATAKEMALGPSSAPAPRVILVTRRDN